MATIDEAQPEEMELDESLLAEEEPEEETPQTQEAVQEDTDEEIPDKYRGKTARELVEMHQAAERVLGRQGNELGEIRSILDDITSGLSEKSSDAPAEPEVDFFEDPRGATARAAQEALKNDPTLRRLEQSLEQQEKATKAQQMSQRHPDYLDIAGSQDFQNWLSKDPWRTKQFTDAGQRFDVDAASSLLSMYKESRQSVAKTAQSAKAQQKNKVNKAATGSGKASSETRGKPILSREALIELKQTDPEKYMAMMPQIKQAYMEKRVR